MSAQAEWVRMPATVTGIEHFMHLWTPNIQCDQCGTQYVAHGLHGWGSAEDPEGTARVIRVNGWRFDGRRHICPVCQGAPLPPAKGCECMRNSATPGRRHHVAH